MADRNFMRPGKMPALRDRFQVFRGLDRRRQVNGRGGKRARLAAHVVVGLARFVPLLSRSGVIAMGARLYGRLSGNAGAEDQRRALRCERWHPPGRDESASDQAEQEQRQSCVRSQTMACHCPPQHPRLVAAAMSPTKRLRIILGLALILAPAEVFAHVTVSPKASSQGAWEKYEIRVPNEAKAETTALEVRFPAGLRVMSFEEKPGWTVEPLRDPSRAIAGARWSGKLAPERFVEFGIIAVNPKEGSELIWTAVQTYADGTVIHWSGPEGSKTPASRVALTRPPR